MLICLLLAISHELHLCLFVSCNFDVSVAQLWHDFENTVTLWLNHKSVTVVPHLCHSGATVPTLQHHFCVTLLGLKCDRIVALTSNISKRKLNK